MAVFLTVVAIAGCARATPRPESDATAPSAVAAPQEALQARIDALEAKLALMNEKFDTMMVKAESPAAQRMEPVLSHPADVAAAHVDPVPSARDPEAGFNQTQAIQLYRQAMIQFRAGKYRDSILAFASFVEKYPDHAMAGAAQFHVGESYFRQKEWALAEQEFKRVLTTYDRSSHVSHSLRQLALVAEQLKKGEDAARYRQMLLSMYPQSPAAEGVVPGKPPEKTAQKAPVATVADEIVKESGAFETRFNKNKVESPIENRAGFDAPPPTLPAVGEE